MSNVERNQFGDGRGSSRNVEPGLGGSGEVGALGEREFDALLNAALDAEAAGDIALAQESWAKIAAMDEARRRSAALLASGLAQLKQGNHAGPDVSGRVLARLNFARTEWDKTIITTMPDAVTAETAPAREVSGTAQAMDHLVGEGRREMRRHRTPMDGQEGQAPAGSSHTLADALAFEAAADSAISSGRAWGVPSQRAHRKRRWYQVSPMLASFVLGGLVTVGLLALKHWTEAPQNAAPIAATPLATPAEPSQLVPELVRAVPRPAPSLQMGDTRRYTQINGLSPDWRMSQTPTAGRWWETPRDTRAWMALEQRQFAEGVRAKGANPASASSGNTLWFNMLEEDDVLDASIPLTELQPAQPRKQPGAQPPRPAPPR
jgi:hypothetical protein